MARKPRIHFPGAVYHVILRGNAGQAIFFKDTDRYRFYLLLQGRILGDDSFAGEALLKANQGCISSEPGSPTAFGTA